MNEFLNYYNKYINYSYAERMRLAQIAYRKMKEQFTAVSNSWNAFNACIDVTLMFLVCDGNLSQSDYNLFLDISGCSPSYDELYQSALHVSKNYDKTCSTIRSYGVNTTASVVYYASVLLACKGSFGQYERFIVERLIR